MALPILYDSSKEAEDIEIFDFHVSKHYLDYKPGQRVRQAEDMEIFNLHVSKHYPDYKPGQRVRQGQCRTEQNTPGYQLWQNTDNSDEGLPSEGEGCVLRIPRKDLKPNRSEH